MKVINPVGLNSAGFIIVVSCLNKRKNSIDICPSHAYYSGNVINQTPRVPYDTNLFDLNFS